MAIKGLTKKQKELAEQEKNQKLAASAKIILARRDLITFGNSVLKDENGNQIEAAPIHQSWWDHLKYCWTINKAGVILAPYAHGKSFWISLALPLWLLGQNPNIRIIMVSSAEDIAAKRLQKVRDYIKNSPELHRIFPWLKLDKDKQNSSHALNVIRESKSGGVVGSVDHSMQAYGYTSSEGQGSRCDVLIFDDVADEKNSCISPATRKNLIGLVTTQWIPRAARPAAEDQAIRSRDGKLLSKKSIICGIGTRFHEEDIYGFWMGSPSAYCILIQSVSQDFGHLDSEIIGAVKNPAHPVLTKYRDYIPEPVTEPITV